MLHRPLPLIDITIIYQVHLGQRLVVYASQPYRRAVIHRITSFLHVHKPDMVVAYMCAKLIHFVIWLDLFQPVCKLAFGSFPVPAYMLMVIKVIYHRLQVTITSN